MITATVAQRLAATAASVAITLAALSGMATYAKPPVANPLLAQSAAAEVVR